MRQHLGALFGCEDIPSFAGPILLYKNDEEDNTVGLTDIRLQKIRKHFK